MKIKYVTLSLLLFILCLGDVITAIQTPMREQGYNEWFALLIGINFIIAGGLVVYKLLNLKHTK